MAIRLRYDIHTHTRYSCSRRGRLHGKGTVEENVAAALARGLETIGISDHGPAHSLYGLDPARLPDLRRDIEASRLAHPDIDITLGVEANICNRSGKLDVDPKDFEYVIAGYHYMAFGESPMRCLMAMAGMPSVSANTDLILAALYANDIRVLTHPGDKLRVDIPAVAKACEETDTLMEINCHHDGLTVDGIRQAMRYDVSFIISSDAHTPEAVGRPEIGLERAERAGLDLSRIVNLEGGPSWKR